MTSPFKSRQLGMTLVSLLFVGGLVAVVGVMTAQVVPSVMEYQTILKAVNKAKEGNTVPEVRMIFDRATSIDSITSITAKDLDVTKEDDKVVVRFAYEREFHLVGPAFLTLKYSGQSN
ncbi:DUF4845 domain-containing protein [Rhodoferax sp.]|uniref:DUF4845 domain-containing protein n=1 Tax=Rhodoferax sp. TaxID=50421 RepID=UPI0025D8205D|nr:DUF4845 domain-containing protein [Rhodoferax sp.]